jgi:sec-independent protein translocase protein TatB
VNFLNIGPGELMVIIAIAILVIGPKRLVQVAQTLGRLTRRGREVWNEVLKTIQAELQETKEVVEEIAQDSSDLSAEVEAAGRETGEAIGGIKGVEESPIDVQAELKAIGQETQQAMKEAAEGFTSIVMGKTELKEDRDEAEDKETIQE